VADSAPQTITCPACKAAVPVPPGQAGKTGRCPTCEAKVSYPAEETVRFRCAACAALLTVPQRHLGKRIHCPRCKESTPVEPLPPAAAAEELAVEKPAPEPQAAPVQRKAKLAWAEFEQSRRDSYYLAMLKAVLYPFQALGVVLLFTLGVPLAAVVVQAVAQHFLKLFPTAEAGTLNPVATAVVLVSLLVFVAIAALLASLLFAIVRVSARGAQGVPVIQGLHHRVNLASFCAWAALCFGPGLLVGFWAAGERELFAFNGASLLLLAAGAAVAPMGLLLTAVHGGDRVFDLGALCRGIGAAGGDYAYLLFMLALAGGLFVGGGIWLGEAATEALVQERPSLPAAYAYRLASWCLYLFPFIAAARLTGLFAHHHRGVLPFAVDSDESGRRSLRAEAVMWAGLALLFLPLHAYGQQVAARADVVNRCARNLERIAAGAYRDQHWRWPQSEAELADRYGGLVSCPFAEETEIDYEVVPVPADPPAEFVVLYDKQRHPDGTRSVLFGRGKVVKDVGDENLEEILALQRELTENPDDIERDRKLRRMRFLRF
jgi:DNA-directed RNA polymerase subunit RPC12/RpoP